jgi:microcystin-dependent protein
MARVQIPVNFGYVSNSTGTTPSYVSSSSSSFTAETLALMEPAASITVTITVRSTGAVATVYQAETGTAVYTTLSTGAKGNVPGWVDPGSYVATAASSGNFGGASVAFEAVRGDSVTNIANGAIDLPQLAADIANALVQTGTILDYAGQIAPTGYVLCDGSVYPIGSSGSTYYALSQVLGTTWNTGGEGSGNFRVPDLRGVTLVGAGSGSGLTSRALATTGGGETCSLTEAQNGPHSHNVSDPGHSHYVDDPGHAHSWGQDLAANINYTSPNTNIGGIGDTMSATNTQPTNINLGKSATGIVIETDGAGNPHPNMQPFVVTNKMVKL